MKFDITAHLFLFIYFLLSSVVECEREKINSRKREMECLNPNEHEKAKNTRGKK